tara:strand:- start:255 stop:830 length:576 start_codon:yes stop_codon:yes gene_type:complete
MSAFNTYLRLGYEHIVNPAALDHIIFIVALTAVYQPKSWLKIILAVTFFTIGHSLTLTLSAFDLVKFDKKLIEFLIPVTIGVTALFNLTKAGQDQKSKSKFWIAGVFGLIHGLGFANYYGMLTLGETKYWSALLPFNLGVELGQLLIVAIILLLMVIFQMMLNTKSQSWNLFFSGTAFGLAVLFCFQNWPF